MGKSKQRSGSSAPLRVCPLESGAYEAVKAQVFRHYRTRHKRGECQCGRKGRMRWAMEKGIWFKHCPECKLRLRAFALGPGLADIVPPFSKWVFPLIRNMGRWPALEELTAVQTLMFQVLGLPAHMAAPDGDVEAACAIERVEQVPHRYTLYERHSNSTGAQPVAVPV